MSVEKYDEEILRRLPFWVREVLKMCEEIRAEKGEGRARRRRTPSSSSSRAP